MLVSYYITEMDHTIPGPGKSEEEGMSGESDEVEVKDLGRRVPDQDAQSNILGELASQNLVGFQYKKEIY